MPGIEVRNPRTSSVPAVAAVAGAAVVPWLWDSGVKRYRGAAGTPFAGMFIGPRQMTQLRDIFLDSQYREMARLANKLSMGEVSIQQWVLEFRQILKEVYIDSYFAAMGGRHAATPADWGRIGNMLRRQYEYLQNFAQDIAAGELSPAKLRWRSNLYINSAVQAFERAKAASYGITLPAYPGDGSTECLVNCRCHWDIRERKTRFACYWRLDLDPLVEHCDDCLDRADLWNPYVIPKVEIRSIPLKHLEGTVHEHDQSTHGRRGGNGKETSLGGRFHIVDTRNELLGNTDGNVLGYWITPDGKLIDLAGSEHALAVVSNPEFFGLEPDVTEHFELVYGAIENGFIRVAEYYDTVGIETYKVNYRTLKNLRRLAEAGKLKIEEYANHWSSGGIGKDEPYIHVAFNREEFWDAEKIVPSKVRKNKLELKHLPGEHDQETHGRWAQGTSGKYGKFKNIRKSDSRYSTKYPSYSAEFTIEGESDSKKRVKASIQSHLERYSTSDIVVTAHVKWKASRPAHKVGHAYFVRQDDGKWAAWGVSVSEEYQRRGIASAMYDFVSEMYDIEIRQSQSGDFTAGGGGLTSEGQSFWDFRSSKKHLPGQHDQESHGNWADGGVAVLERVSSAGYNLVDRWDEIGKSGHISAWIMPDGKIMDLPVGAHINAIEDLPDLFGISKEDVQNESPRVLMTKVLDSGAVRVVKTPYGTYVQTGDVDMRTLRKLRRLVESRKLEIGKDNLWSNDEANTVGKEYKSVNFTWDEFWDAERIREFNGILELKHLPGEHDQLSHGNWADGVAIAELPSDFKIVETYKDVYDPQGYWGGGYWITPDNDVLDIGGKEHYESVKEHPEFFGATSPDEDREYQAFENGFIRVRMTNKWSAGRTGTEYTQGTVQEANFNTARMNTKTFRRLKKLALEGKLPIVQGARHVWANNEPDVPAILFSFDTFWDSEKVKQIGNSRYLKHLPGEHDQESHGNWADGGVAVLERESGLGVELQTDRYRIVASDKEAGEGYYITPDNKVLDIGNDHHGNALLDEPDFFGLSEYDELGITDFDTLNEAVLEKGFIRVRRYHFQSGNILIHTALVDDKTLRRIQKLEWEGILYLGRENRPLAQYERIVWHGKNGSLKMKIGELWDAERVVKIAFASDGESHIYELKHYPGEHDQKDHGNWARGRGVELNKEPRSSLLQTGRYRIRQTIDQISRSDGYWITPEGDLLDLMNGVHGDALYWERDFFGLSLESQEDFRFYEAHKQAISKGFIRVRGGDYAKIETEKIDMRTLRKLRELALDKKLKIFKGVSNYWSSTIGDGSVLEGTAVRFNWDEFWNTERIVPAADRTWGYDLELKSIKHLPGEHDQESHGNWAGDSEPFGVYESRSEMGKGKVSYWVLPDGRLMDCGGYTHDDAIRYNPNRFGIGRKQPSWKFTKDALQRGAVRVVAFGRGAEIETDNIDNSTLRKLRRLAANGKISVGKDNTWSEFWRGAENTIFINFTDQEFWNAEKVVRSRTQDFEGQLKHLEGTEHEHDQESHGNWADGDVAAGGAQPEDTQAKDAQVTISGDWDRWGEFGQTEESLRKMFEWEGVNAHIEAVFDEGTASDFKHRVNYLRVTVSWKNDQGEEIGKALVKIGPHEGGVTEMTWLGVEDSHDQQGVGRKIFRQVVKQLKKSGYKEMKFFAAGTIGRYAWAKIKGIEPIFGNDVKGIGGRFWRWMNEKGVPAWENWQNYKRQVPEDIDDWDKEKSSAWFDDMFNKEREYNQEWKDYFSGMTYAEFADFEHPEGFQLKGSDIENKDVAADESLGLGKAYMLDMGDWGFGAWDAVLNLKENP